MAPSPSFLDHAPDTSTPPERPTPQETRAPRPALIPQEILLTPGHALLGDAPVLTALVDALHAIGGEVRVTPSPDHSTDLCGVAITLHGETLHGRLDGELLSMAAARCIGAERGELWLDGVLCGVLREDDVVFSGPLARALGQNAPLLPVDLECVHLDLKAAGLSVLADGFESDHYDGRNTLHTQGVRVNCAGLPERKGTLYRTLSGGCDLHVALVVDGETLFEHTYSPG